MKQILTAILLVGLAVPAAAQQLTTEQKVLLVLTGMDAGQNAVPLPSDATVTWELVVPAPGSPSAWADVTSWVAAPEYGEMVPSDATTAVRGWWFVTKSKSGVVRVRASVKLAGAATWLPTVYTDITVLGGVIVKVVLGYAGSPVPK